MMKIGNKKLYLKKIQTSFALNITFHNHEKRPPLQMQSTFLEIISVTNLNSETHLTSPTYDI